MLEFPFFCVWIINLNEFLGIMVKAFVRKNRYLDAFCEFGKQKGNEHKLNTNINIHVIQNFTVVFHHWIFYLKFIQLVRTYSILFTHTHEKKWKIWLLEQFRDFQVLEFQVAMLKNNKVNMLIDCRMFENFHIYLVLWTKIQIDDSCYLY